MNSIADKQHAEHPLEKEKQPHGHQAREGATIERVLKKEDKEKIGAPQPTLPSTGQISAGELKVTTIATTTNTDNY
jgi:hypothetical protein